MTPVPCVGTRAGRRGSESWTTTPVPSNGLALTKRKESAWTSALAARTSGSA
jgi:hypothetical protein